MLDDTTGRDEKPVSIGRKNLRLALDVEPIEDVVSLPIARVKRDGAGHFMYDPEYVLHPRTLTKFDTFVGINNDFTSCNPGTAKPWEPNGNTFARIGATTTSAPAPPTWYQLDPASASTLGDGILDGDIDTDHDGISNYNEITGNGDANNGTYSNPIDPCDPSIDAASCPTHPSHT